MKAAKAALALGVNERTLNLWIAHPALSPFFSEAARLEGSQRELNDDDLIVANTIRAMRAGVPNNAANWEGIAEALASGRRHRNLPPEAAMVDAGLTVMAQRERMITVLSERDAALARVEELQAAQRELEQRLAAIEAERRQDQEKLLRELKETERALTEKLARAETELELWRSGRIKPAE